MPAWLLDVNVLVARQDLDHEHHDRVAGWWQQHAADGWATCPLTENGVVRILGHPSYPGWPGTPQRAAAALRELIAAIPGHRFLPDEVSLLDLAVVPSLEGVGPRALTDLYLLALAVHHGAAFATLDARIRPELVPVWREALIRGAGGKIVRARSPVGGGLFRGWRAWPRPAEAFLELTELLQAALTPRFGFGCRQGRWGGRGRRLGRW